MVVSLKLPTESLDRLFDGILSTEEWKKAQQDFCESDVIFIIGNGGNLAVADHGSVDITRLSKKLAIAPGSGILATSIIGDNCIDTWFSNWLDAHIEKLSSDQKIRSLVIGISSSGTANNILACLNHAFENNMKTLLISGRNVSHANINTVCINTDYYHTGEVMSLMLFYQLIHGSGVECPSISKKLGQKSFDRLVNP